MSDVEKLLHEFQHEIEAGEQEVGMLDSPEVRERITGFLAEWFRGPH